jgi:hypothetical protein
MQSSADHLFAAAMQLPDIDRAKLAFQLLESLPEDVELVTLDDPEFLTELDNRFADQSGAIPWSQLRNEG